MFQLPPASLFIGGDPSVPSTAVVEAPLTIHQHSWYGRVVHVQTSNGSILRGQCRELTCHAGHVSVKVSFRQNKMNKKKHVSPIALVALHILWLSRDIVSDDEDSAENDTTDDTDTLTSVLPTLAIERAVQSALTPAHVTSLSFVCTQVASLLKLI